MKYYQLQIFISTLVFTMLIGCKTDESKSTTVSIVEESLRIPLIVRYPDWIEPR